MPIRPRTVRRGVLAVAAVLALVAASVPAAGAAPAPGPAVAGSTAGGSWDVTRVGDAYDVRLTLPAAVPVRAALPQLAVDGVVVGTARQDADGRTLRARTTDPRAATASRVELAWNGAVAGTAPVAAGAPDPAPTASGSVLGADPTTASTYRVTRADYDLGDTAVRLPGLGGQAVELRAAVYLPAGAPGRRPVVVFLHGRHQPCYVPGDAKASAALPLAWPCTGRQLPVPSHLGYGEAADALAAAGYVVVSISADGVNALDFGATDGGAEARGELVLAHLDRLQAWNAGRGGGPEATALQGRLDLNDVGLMGHSRGGEGVVAAALLNSARPSPYGIRAVMPLAPTDFGRATLPGVSMAVVLPYCDGDVSDQQGQHFLDDSRYAAPDRAARSALLVMGANHNYFNSEWTPGTSAAPSFDDWYAPEDATCGQLAPGRLSAAEQRAVGAAYIAGFFRLHLGDEQQFLPLFDGTGGRAASAGRAVVFTEAQQPTGSRTVLAPLTGRTAGVTTTPGAVFCAGYGTATPDGTPPCAPGTTDPFFVPHWTPAYLAPDVPTAPMLHLTWSAGSTAGVTVRVPELTGVRQALTFRAGVAGRARADLTVTVTDGAGRSGSARVADLGPALTPLPRVPSFSGRPQPKVWLRTVRLPLAALVGVDTSDLATVRITSAGAAGDVYLSDLAFDAPAPGAGGVIRLPAVDIGDAFGFASRRGSTVTFGVSLTAPSTVPVTVQVDTGASGLPQLPARWTPVTIRPGATLARVTVTLAPDPTEGGDAVATYPVTISVPTGAVVGDAVGTLTVYPSAAGVGGSGSGSG